MVSVYNCPILFVHVVGDDIPKSAWLIRRIGRLTAGVQYEPQSKFFTLIKLLNLGVTSLINMLIIFCIKRVFIFAF